MSVWWARRKFVGSYCAVQVAAFAAIAEYSVRNAMGWSDRGVYCSFFKPGFYLSETVLFECCTVGARVV